MHPSSTPDPLAQDPLQRVDPELRGALAALPDLATLSAATLPALRAALAGAPLAEEPPELSITRVDIPGADDGPPVGALLYQPSGGRRLRPALLHLHGGGYVAGSAARDDPAMRDLAFALDCVILSVDYRLAPETPFPGALEDAYAALAWLHANAARLKVDPKRIALRGNSAGGGLAAALALLARDRGRYPIAFLTLVYPMLDDRTAAHSVCGRHVWTADANAFGWSAYLGDTAERDAASGYAVPARAEALVGLPPVWIGCGALDLFVDENLQFARRLIDAGVPAEVHVYPGAFHGFNLVAAAVSRRFERDLRAALAAALSP